MNRSPSPPFSRWFNESLFQRATGTSLRAFAPVRHCHADVTCVIFLSLSPPRGEGAASAGTSVNHRQPLAAITTKRWEGVEALRFRFERPREFPIEFPIENARTSTDTSRDF